MQQNSSGNRTRVSGTTSKPTENMASDTNDGAVGQVTRPTSLKIDQNIAGLSNVNGIPNASFIASLNELKNMPLSFGQLNSPELKLFSHAGHSFLGFSPDVDKIISQLSATSPQTPTSFLNPKDVTNEQEQFADDFTKKLIEIKQEREGAPRNDLPQLTDISYSTVGFYQTPTSAGQAPTTPQILLVASNALPIDQANSGLSVASLAEQNPTIATMEPTTSSTIAARSIQPPEPPQFSSEQNIGSKSTGGPSSVSSSEFGGAGSGTPGKSGIKESGDPYRMKLERKRARNRDAARKCRERKVQLIKVLEKEVDGLTQQNRGLETRIRTYRSEVEQLKRFVIEHVQKGCPMGGSNTSSS